MAKGLFVGVCMLPAGLAVHVCSCTRGYGVSRAFRQLHLVQSERQLVVDMYFTCSCMSMHSTS